MPLLPLEPFIFPESLLDSRSPAEGDGLRWWVLHTRPRAEKALARRILNDGTGFFLPLYRRQWRSRGRILTSYLPLFPGYLFMRGDGDTRLRALETNLVANCLPVGDQARMWRDLARVAGLVGPR